MIKKTQVRMHHACLMMGHPFWTMHKFWTSAIESCGAGVVKRVACCVIQVSCGRFWQSLSRRPSPDLTDNDLYQVHCLN